MTLSRSSDDTTMSQNFVSRCRRAEKSFGCNAASAIQKTTPVVLGVIGSAHINQRAPRMNGRLKIWTVENLLQSDRAVLTGGSTRLRGKPCRHDQTNRNQD